MAIPQSLPRKLKEIRTRSGLSKTGMVKALKYQASHLYPSDISQFERGDRQPPFLVALAYARFGGFDMSVLIDDDLSLD